MGEGDNPSRPGAAFPILRRIMDAITRDVQAVVIRFFLVVNSRIPPFTRQQAPPSHAHLPPAPGRCVRA